MTAQENKQLAKRFFEDVLTEGQVELIDKLVAEDYVEHEVPPGQEPPADGRQALKEMVEGIREGIPDLEVHVDKLLADGDLVAIHTRWSGTHAGPLWGIEPTNEQVSFHAVDIVRIEDGRAREHWGVTDNLSLFSQVGAVEPPET